MLLVPLTSQTRTCIYTIMTSNDPGPKRRSTTDVAACICANLRKAARVVTQTYDAALQSTGLKATQFTLLATLAKRGELPHTKLAEALVMDRTTLTRNLKPLVEQGCINVRHDEDQRVRRISLTGAGLSRSRIGVVSWKR